MKSNLIVSIRPKKCIRCKRRFIASIGDVMPVMITCPFCGNRWLVTM